MNMAEAIKKCALDAFEATAPCDVIFALCENEEPICFKYKEMDLTDEIVVVPEHLKYKEEIINTGTWDKKIIIRDGIKKGDVVVLLRQSGAMKYVAIGII